MSYSTRFRNTLAAASLVCLPILVFAQTSATPATTQVAAAKPSGQGQAQAAARTREEVSRETQAAMRDGSWRCLTNNRGWCSTPPVTRGPATSKDAAS